MARARNLKPQFFTDAELVECEFWVRLLFAGLWTLADRRGILADKPKQIKIDLFPNDAVDIEAGLAALDKIGVIRRYQSQDGVCCIRVVNFLKHQNPHKDEKPNELPEEHPTSEVVTPGQHSVNRADSLNTDSLSLDSSPRIPDCLERARGAPAKPKQATQIPEDWQPTDAEVSWATSEGFMAPQIVSETEKFRDHHRAKGNTFKDIGLAWKNWMRRSREYAPRGSPATNGRRESPAAVFARMAMEDG